MWRKLSEEDTITINMRYIRICDFRRYIDVFVFQDEPDDEIVLEDKSAGIRWNPYGFFIGKDMYCFDTKIYTYLRVIKEKDFLRGYASRDGKTWEYINKIEISKYNRDRIQVGIHVYMGKDYYTIWKNMNFIQLVYNPNNEYKGIYLDYYFFPRKNVDNSYFCFPNFLETHYDTIYDAMDCFGTIHDYIHWNLKHFYYLEICLNEFYVPMRRAYYTAQYDHYNLFYGYDDDNREYYVMGYGENGKPMVSKLPYDAFENNIITSEKIIRYKYVANEVTNLRFNITPVKNSLYEFLNSVDSSEKVSNFLTQEPLIYGLSIFDYLATEELGRKILIDWRISFCIVEHGKMMKERLAYLYNHAYLEYQIFRELCILNDEVIKLSSRIMNLCMMGVIKSRTYEQVFEYLKELKNMEKELFEKLLNSL